MSKKNTLREQRRAARAARRRNQRILAGALFGVAVVLIGFLVFQAVANREPEAEQPPAADFPAGAEEVTELQIEDLVVGEGIEAKAGDLVIVHYTGWLTDGTKFDSSLDRGAPFNFTLGQGGVIQGWDQGVAGMQTGGVRRLTIPPDLAYGPEGRPPTIPPNATLIFEVELVSITSPD